MEDIIKQIVQIDSVALNTKRANEEALNAKKKEYEREMETYKEKTLETAKKEADKVYKQIVDMGMEEHTLEAEKSKKAGLCVKNRYLQMEQKLVHTVFTELFGLEG